MGIEMLPPLYNVVIEPPLTTVQLANEYVGYLAIEKGAYADAHDAAAADSVQVIDFGHRVLKRPVTGYQIWRGMTVIDTSSLAGKVIYSASLDVFGSGGDFDDGDYDAVIVPGLFTYPGPVVGDYGVMLGAITVLGSIKPSTVVLGQWNSIPLTIEGLAAIDQSAKTKFGFRCQMDIDDIAPGANSNNQVSGNTRLTVKYVT